MKLQTARAWELFRTQKVGSLRDITFVKADGSCVTPDLSTVRQSEHDEIVRQTEVFLAKGGVVKEFRQGETAVDHNMGISDMAIHWRKKRA